MQNPTHAGFQFLTTSDDDGNARETRGRVFRAIPNPNEDGPAFVWEMQRTEEGLSPKVYRNATNAKTIEEYNKLPPWAKRINDESQWANIRESDFVNLAKNRGYTGPAGTELEFLYGMRGKGGGAIPKGEYGAGAGNNIGDWYDALDSYAAKNNAELRNEFLSGYQRSKDDFGIGDLGAALWTAGVGGMAASGLGAIGGVDGVGEGALGGGLGEAGAEGAIGGASDLGADLGFTGGAAGGDISGVGGLAGGASGGTTVGAVGGELSGLGGATLGGALGGSPGTFIDAAGNVIDAGAPMGGTAVGGLPGGGNPVGELPPTPPTDIPGNDTLSGGNDTLTGGGTGGDISGGGTGGGLSGPGDIPIDGLPSGWLDELKELISGIPSNIWGAGIQGLLGYLGADAKGDALKDIYHEQSAIGAPYRDLLLQSYQPGFNLYDQPGYGDALNRTAEISARAAGVRGNPGTTPSLQGDILNNVWQQGFLPAQANYRGGLMQAGGLGLNTSGQAALAGADFSSPWLTGLGAGTGTLFGNQQNQQQQPKPLQTTIGGNPWGN